ncbi:MAG: hypothetical protein ABIB93_03715 [Chloroflexota bacterium]
MLLAIGTVCLLAQMAITPIPAQVAVVPVIELSPEEGKIGEWVLVSGYNFGVNTFIKLYFSSQKKETGSIGSNITAYQSLGMFFTDNSGKIYEGASFQIPHSLTDGVDREEVHGGKYHVLATYSGSNVVIAFAVFSIATASMEVEPGEGLVGSKVTISGKEMRPHQKITASYDGKSLAIDSGDEITDDKGRFWSTILIPESANGEHTIAVADESGNKPTADFTVGSEISLSSTAPSIGGIVEITGTGFGERKPLSIYLDGRQVPAMMAPVYTSRYGSFRISFTMPFDLSYIDGGTFALTVLDTSTAADAMLSISPMTPIIKLTPETTADSPGRVGMTLTVNGAWFPAHDIVRITYDAPGNLLATVAVKDDRTFSTRITIPPGSGRTHEVTATSGETSISATVIIEQQKPPVPVLTLPEAAQASWDTPELYWKGIVDPGGITYTLQIGRDTDMSSILLEKEGLIKPKYSFLPEEKQLLGKSGDPRYWRVKATDTAGNESKWSVTGVFYVGFSWSQIPAWALYAWAGLGLLLAFFVFRWLRNIYAQKQREALSKNM